LLRTLDYVGLMNAVLFSCAIIKAFFSNWALYQRAQAVFYLTQASVQLLVMHCKPQQYQRHRFRVGLMDKGQGASRRCVAAATEAAAC
jgi:hypothetical protein